MELPPLQFSAAIQFVSAIMRSCLMQVCTPLPVALSALGVSEIKLNLRVSRISLRILEVTKRLCIRLQENNHTEF
jgi:hypothetical protein